MPPVLFHYSRIALRLLITWTIRLINKPGTDGSYFYNLSDSSILLFHAACFNLSDVKLIGYEIHEV